MHAPHLLAQTRRAESTAAQLEREAASRESALGSRGDEVASLQEAARSAQAQLQQYVVDLTAFERQADGLSRQVRAGSAERAGMGRACGDGPSCFIPCTALSTLRCYLWEGLCSLPSAQSWQGAESTLWSASSRRISLMPSSGVP